jgi:hypothetical protein
VVEFPEQYVMDELVGCFFCIKKEKDPKIPGNYRGIAVTPVLGKILESIIKDHIEPTLTKVQNPMRRTSDEHSSNLGSNVVIPKNV